MNRRKDKSLAAMLAFFGGIVGLHRFYLGQIKLGVFMIILSVFTLGMLTSLIGLIDSIVFFSMDPDVFDMKYNKEEKEYKHVRSQHRTKRRRKVVVEAPDYRRQDRRRFSGERSKIRVNKRNPLTGNGDKNKDYKETLKRIENYKNQGIHYFKEYDFEESIKSFKKVISLDSHNVAAHFNIACAYSQIEDTTKAIRHLDLAVKNGFKDFDKIRKHDKLSLTRIQREWEVFEANGFQLPISESKDVENTSIEADEKINEVKQPIVVESIEKSIEIETNIPTNDSLFENLKKLKELRERGLISDREFQSQRKKLLS